MPSISNFSPLPILTRLGSGLKNGAINVAKKVVMAARWARGLMSRCYYYLNPKSLERRDIKKALKDEEKALLSNEQENYFQGLDQLPEIQKNITDITTGLASLLKLDNFLHYYLGYFRKDGAIFQLIEILMKLLESVPKGSITHQWCHNILAGKTTIIGIPLLNFIQQTEEEQSNTIEYFTQLPKDQQRQGLADLCECLTRILQCIDNPGNKTPDELAQDRLEQEKLVQEKLDQEKADAEKQKDAKTTSATPTPNTNVSSSTN